MNLNPFRRKPDLTTNEALVKAIVAVAARPTPDAEHTYYNEVLKSKLYLADDPVASPRPILLVDESDEIVMPVFTDIMRLKKVFPDAQRFGAMSGQEICQLALKNTIFIININPQHGPGCHLLRSEIEALANGQIPDISADEPPSWDEPEFIPMGDPQLPTPDLLDKIMESGILLLQREIGVRAAYIIMVGSRLTVALQFNPSASYETKTQFTRSLVSSLEVVSGFPMNIVWLEGEQLKEVQKRVEPFYEQNV